MAEYFELTIAALATLSEGFFLLVTLNICRQRDVTVVECDVSRVELVHVLLLFMARRLPRRRLPRAHARFILDRHRADSERARRAMAAAWRDEHRTTLAPWVIILVVCGILHHLSIVAAASSLVSLIIKLLATIINLIVHTVTFLQCFTANIQQIVCSSVLLLWQIFVAEVAAHHINLPLLRRVARLPLARQVCVRVRNRVEI